MPPEAQTVTVALPQAPAELWMLWVVDGIDGIIKPGWCGSADDPRGARSYLVHTSEHEAKLGAEHKFEVYGLTCVPVRVK